MFGELGTWMAGRAGRLAPPRTRRCLPLCPRAGVCSPCREPTAPCSAPQARQTLPFRTRVRAWRLRLRGRWGKLRPPRGRCESGKSRTGGVKGAKATLLGGKRVTGELTAVFKCAKGLWCLGQDEPFSLPRTGRKTDRRRRGLGRACPRLCRDLCI